MERPLPAASLRLQWRHRHVGREAATRLRKTCGRPTRRVHDSRWAFIRSYDGGAATRWLVASGAFSATGSPCMRASRSRRRRQLRHERRRRVSAPFADRHPMLSALRKQKRAVVVAQNPCSAHQHDAFYGLLTMMADAGLPDPLAWAACRCGWIAGECSGGGGRFGTVAWDALELSRVHKRAALRALGDENRQASALLEAPHHFARGFTTRASPPCPACLNGGTIGPIDEYRAQGMHRTLQGAPPGDKWYSGSFELLVLWVHYGRPKGEWLAAWGTARSRPRCEVSRGEFAIAPRAPQQ